MSKKTFSVFFEPGNKNVGGKKRGLSCCFVVSFFWVGLGNLWNSQDVVLLEKERLA